MDKLFSFLRNMAEKFLNVSYSVSDILAFSLLLNPSMKVMTEFIEEHNVSMSNFSQLFTGVGLASLVYGFKSIFKKLSFIDSIVKALDISKYSLVFSGVDKNSYPVGGVKTPGESGL